MSRLTILLLLLDNDNKDYNDNNQYNNNNNDNNNNYDYNNSNNNNNCNKSDFYDHNYNDYNNISDSYDHKKNIIWNESKSRKRHEVYYIVTHNDHFYQNHGNKIDNDNDKFHCKELNCLYFYGY